MLSYPSDTISKHHAKFENRTVAEENGYIQTYIVKTHNNTITLKDYFCQLDIFV